MISLQTTSALSGEVVCSCQRAEDCLRMVVGEEEEQNWDEGNAGMVWLGLALSLLSSCVYMATHLVVS